MCPLQRVCCALFLLSLMHFSHCEQSNNDKDITVDICNDTINPGNWEFPTDWNMLCFDDVETLEKSANGDKYNTMIPSDFNWSALKRNGILAFFSQETPPAVNLPPPVITYHSVQSQLLSVSLSFFMYGSKSDNITISARNVHNEIANECGTSCKNFIDTEEIPLLGAYGFNIYLNTTPGSSFVLIDKIVIIKSDVPTRPPSLSLSTKSNPDEPLTDPPTSTPMDSGDDNNNSDPNSSSLSTNIYSLFGMSLSTMMSGGLILISQFGNFLFLKCF